MDKKHGTMVRRPVRQSVAVSETPPQGYCLATRNPSFNSKTSLSKNSRNQSASPAPSHIILTNLSTKDSYLPPTMNYHRDGNNIMRTDEIISKDGRESTILWCCYRPNTVASFHSVYAINNEDRMLLEFLYVHRYMSFTRMTTNISLILVINLPIVETSGSCGDGKYQC